MTAEFYNCAVEVMRGAEAVSRYRSLPEQEAFDIEYWWLEENKLRRMPPEKPLDRQVIVLFGAGNGIGKEAAHRVAREGAHLVCVDLKEKDAEETREELIEKLGNGIGVAGSGISGSGPAIAAGADITNRENVLQVLKKAVLAYGGVDAVVVTAGVFIPPNREGKLSDELFSKTLDVNVKGSYIVAEEAYSRVLAPQNLRANIVLTTSANAVVSKKGSVAYDTSKAAANHLVRELAVELAPLVRVNAIAPATVVQGSTMFPRERVIASLTKYDIPFDEKEDDDSLRSRLADFYAKRTLTGVPLAPEDQAEGIYILLTNQLSKTTGQILAIDGGLHEAFLR